MTHEELKPCPVCKQVMTIRDTIFCGTLEKHPRMTDYDGKLSLRASNGTYYLHYENSGEIFWTEIELTDSWPIRFCPVCGRDLTAGDVA